MLLWIMKQPKNTMKQSKTSIRASTMQTSVKGYVMVTTSKDGNQKKNNSTSFINCRC